MSCLTCHQMGDHVMGSTDGAEGPCRPVSHAALRSVVKMCFGCHNQHEAGSEWLVSPYGPHATEPPELARPSASATRSVSYRRTPRGTQGVDEPST